MVPEVSVLTLRTTCPVASLITFTFAPEITAPDASSTVPNLAQRNIGALPLTTPPCFEKQLSTRSGLCSHSHLLRVFRRLGPGGQSEIKTCAARGVLGSPQAATM